MLKDITFGQYFDTSSLIHKLDPRTKLVLMIAIIVFLFLIGSINSLIVSVVFTFLLILISKVPVKMYLKNIKAIWIIVLFTAVINLFYTVDGAEIIFAFWKLKITDVGIFRAVLMASRIVLLVLISSILTYSTTPNDLTDGIENLLSPLKFLGLGSVVHTLAMMTTIALRFIPTLVEETEKIMNAQKARGADLENGKLKERIKALIPILIPLLISSLRRAYELAEAMECRCYNGGVGRKRMKQLNFKFGDLIALLVTAAFCTLIIFVD